jgi:hypothetical protein
MTPADTFGHQAKVSKRPVNRIACVPNSIGKSSSMACHDPLDHALPLVTPNASTPATVHGYGSAAEDKQTPPKLVEARDDHRVVSSIHERTTEWPSILDPEQGAAHTPP